MRGLHPLVKHLFYKPYSHNYQHKATKNNPEIPSAHAKSESNYLSEAY